MLHLLFISLFMGTTGIPVGEERIRKAVEEYIYVTSGASRQEMVIEVRGRFPNLAVSTGDYWIRVGLEAAPKFKGYASIPIEIVCQGKVEAKTSISVRIRTFGTVLVTSRQLLRHEGVTKDDLTHRQIETTILPDDWVSDVRWIVGKRMVRMISENTVLCRTMLENMPLVRQGDPLTIMVGSHNAVVKVQGIAKQDGCIGDRITVQRTGSHERFQGRIISEHAVEIELDERASLPQKD